MKGAFDARGNQLSVCNVPCARKRQLEVCANPAQNLLQCWVFHEPVPILLIGGAEVVDDSGVGDCSQILILCCQYGG